MSCPIDSHCKCITVHVLLVCCKLRDESMQSTELHLTFWTQNTPLRHLGNKLRFMVVKQQKLNGTDDKCYIIIWLSSLDICSLTESFILQFSVLYLTFMMHICNSVSSTTAHSLGFNWHSFSPFTQYALLI